MRYLLTQYFSIVSHLGRSLLYPNPDRMQVRSIVVSKRPAQLAADIFRQPLGCGVINWQLDHVRAGKNIALLLEAYLPALRRSDQLKVRIVQRQQKTVIEPLADFPGQSFNNGKIKVYLILIERSLDLNLHVIVVALQLLQV